jgi:hypothetical protein
MKYLKNLRRLFENFESREDQIEDIKSIFNDFLEKKSISEDGEEYEEYELVEDDPTCLFFTFYKYDSDVACNDMDEFDEYFKEREVSNRFLKELRIALLRLDALEYKWGFSIDENGVYIKVFYKDTKLTLSDAFGGGADHSYPDRMNSIDENIMKEVFKRDYNIIYGSSSYTPSTSGRYGSRARINIGLRTVINEDSQIIKDIKALTKINTLYPDSPPQRAFYSVKVWGDNNIVIEV